MDSNHPKRGGYKEESPPAPKGESPVQRLVWCVLLELKGVLQSSVTTGEAANRASELETTSTKEFCEQRRCKRNSSDGQATTAKKPSAPATSANDPRLRQQHEVSTRNFFAPLRSSEMETGKETAEDPSENQEQQAAPSHISRPPTIVLNSKVNLIALQRQLKSIAKGSFEFRSTKNGTRVVTKEMANYSAIRAHFESRNLPHYTP
jgi:hypothetical protein